MESDWWTDEEAAIQFALELNRENPGVAHYVVNEAGQLVFP